MRDGWRVVRLDEAAEVTIGRQRSPKHAQGSHLVPYLRAANVKDGRLLLSDVLLMNFTPQEQATFALAPGDVLVSEGCGSIEQLGASARYGGELPGTVCFQNTLLRLRARPGVADPAFIDIWARDAHATGAFARVANGTSIFHIGATRAQVMPVILPPLVEQRRIVNLLAAVDEVRRGNDRLLGASSQMTEALVEDLIFAASDAEKWPYRTLRDLGGERSLIGGPFGSSLVSNDYVEVGVPVIRGTNLSTGTRWVGGNFVFVSPEKADALSRNLASPGDVIFTQRGTLGQVAIVPTTHERFVVSQSQMRLRVAPNKALADYVYFVFRSPRLTSAIEDRKIATANPHINLGILAELTIPVPDLERQRTIVECLLAGEQQGGALKAQALTLDRARSALLTDLLSGTHEIPASYDQILEPV